jgi:uncharacterized protein (TIGR02646 family)
MILLPDVALPDGAAAGLRALQAEVDSAGSYAEQVAEGKRLFDLRNTRGNPVFDEVKRTLDRMCSGALRCAYCEDSRADEIEHVRPKSLYPNVVFAWSNYVYACGPCNGPKGNHFAVFVGDATAPTEVARKPYAPIAPPPHGEPALIDPRVEDATNLMMLDLRETYLFTPLAAKGTRDRERADYTIRTLRLNTRDDLLRSRRQAYLDYVAHITSTGTSVVMTQQNLASRSYATWSENASIRRYGARSSASTTSCPSYDCCSRRSRKRSAGNAPSSRYLDAGGCSGA